MAKVKLSALVSAMAGSLSGSAMSTTSGTMTLKNKAYPKKSNSPRRLKNLNIVSSLAGLYNGLSTAEKNSWGEIAKQNPSGDFAGDFRPISGYAYFLKLNQFLSSGEQPLVTIPVATQNRKIEFSIAAAEFNVISTSDRFLIESILVDFTPRSIIPVGFVINFYLYYPTGSNGKNNTGRKVFLAAMPIQVTLFPGNTFRIVFPYPQVPGDFPAYQKKWYRLEATPVDTVSLSFTPSFFVNLNSALLVLSGFPVTWNPALSGPLNGMIVSVNQLTRFGFRPQRLSSAPPWPYTQINISIGYQNKDPQKLDSFKKIYFLNPNFLSGGGATTFLGLSNATALIVPPFIINTPVNFSSIPALGNISRLGRFYDPLTLKRMPLNAINTNITYL